MKWAYGVTTVQGRRSELLPRTLDSLAAGGFPKPRLFVDGVDRRESYERFGLPLTLHYPKVRAYCNWVLALWELYAREPEAARYAIFQDDLVTYPNLRQYLESCEYPAKGYWNLYTFPVNQRLYNKNIGSDKIGWAKANQRGLGAVGLVFNREAVQRLLSSRHIVDRPASANRRRRVRALDGAVLEAFRKIGWKEYIHNPSLLQHTGQKSAIGNGKQELAPSFRGEDFDATELIPTHKKPRVVGSIEKARIGLVGFCCASGLGEKNRQLSTFLPVDNWLVIKHRNYQNHEPPKHLKTTFPKTDEDVERFVKSVDVVVFDETPYHNRLLHYANKHSRRVVCVPAMEWMPSPSKPSWCKSVDLFICPTRQCYELFNGVYPCTLFPWPCDTERFKFRQRTVVKEFLFLNGNGGWKGRKGAGVIREALGLWPEFPLVIRSQRRVDFGPGPTTLPSPQENYQAYERGDVLILPHSVDGTALEPREALACGMPVISTDGRPWDEYPNLATIRAGREHRRIKRPVDWYTPKAGSLVAVCKALLGTDISAQSQSARSWAEEHSFDRTKDRLYDLVTRGRPG